MKVNYKIGIIIMAVIIIMCIMVGCNDTPVPKDVEATDVDAAPTLAHSVQWFNSPYEEFVWYDDSARKTVSQDTNPHVVLDDAILQESIKEIAATLPIDTEEAVSAYAWKILPILVSSGYLEESRVPTLASHCTNGVWIISYSMERNGKFPDRDGTVDVFISEMDGHIIFIYPDIRKTD